jgi:hypothetical protein
LTGSSRGFLYASWRRRFCKHQLPEQPLGQRLSAHELLQLADQLRVLPQREVCPELPLERRQPQLLEPSDRSLRKRL